MVDVERRISKGGRRYCTPLIEVMNDIFFAEGIGIPQLARIKEYNNIVPVFLRLRYSKVQ
jgi:hypothetical protein